MFHDSKMLVRLICHKDMLTIHEQIVLAKFIEDVQRNETISQYKFKGHNIVNELLSFAKTWTGSTTGGTSSSQVLDDSDDEESGDNILS